MHHPPATVVPAINVVLATCRRKPELTPGDALLRMELELRGATAVAKAWDAVNPAGTPALVCLRSTWDYHLRWPDFRHWVGGFADRPGVLWNPPETVLWNGDKVDLRELAAAGIALPPTHWFDAGERPDCDALLRKWGMSRAVLKPRISATAYGTYLVSPGRSLADSDWTPLEAAGGLLQAFVPEIETLGEVSLVFIDGTFGHAIRKRPGQGDFRVQSDFGGRWERITASAPLRGFGERVLAASSRQWLYARVDLVETGRSPVLMELELIEPDLFLTHAPDAAGRLATALLARAPRPAA
ncbi:MAG: ATP-grasp domain-containing protein [Gemmatimonadales bacterium]